MTIHGEGYPPEKCDLCKQPIQKVAYDASVPAVGGSWAWMCESCFRQYGCQLGQGQGQRYEKNDAKKPDRFFKTAG